VEAADKRWVIRPQDPALSKHIAQALNISPLVSQVLINRGIDSPEQAGLFLSARLSDLHSPFLMKDMDRAVSRVLAALAQKEKICICGDYDVDGITATALLMLFLRDAGAEVFFYIPSRIAEGYGLSIDAINKIKKQGARLIITVDCGISDVEPVAYAAAQGIEVIVTDHHEPPDVLAPALALLNPKQPGCPFPFKGLAGVGVAFNLVMALRKQMRDQGLWQGNEPNLKKYLDLVAVGTIADIVPMIDENRILVKNGLPVVAEGSRPGIRALKQVSGIATGAVTSTMVGYRLAPRMNASGRISDAEMSVRLLLATEQEEALSLARRIDEENTRRQQIERSILSDARSMIKADAGMPASLVLSSPDWHPGVVGLCASRLCEEFNRPAILIAIDAGRGEGRGSARSIQGFDMYGAIKQCAPLLKAFGGHKDAAGLTVRVERIDAFVQRFNEIVQQEFSVRDFSPVITIDAEIPLGQLSPDILEELESLAPFGPLHPEPVFCSRDIKSYSAMIVGNGHLKLKIKEDKGSPFFDAIGFNMGARYALTDEAIRLAFVPQFNIFNGERLIQLNLRDIKVCESCLD
jgi:single-stranded-DNA-specific exonuclease